MRSRRFYRFLVRCAALVLAFAVIQHRSPRLRDPAAFEQIKEKKRRPRAVQAVILRARSEAQRATAALPDPPREVPKLRDGYRVPEPRPAQWRRRTCAQRSVAPPFVTRHIPRMGSDEPPRA